MILGDDCLSIAIFPGVRQVERSGWLSDVTVNSPEQRNSSNRLPRAF